MLKFVCQLLFIHRKDHVVFTDAMHVYQLCNVWPHNVKMRFKKVVKKQTNKIIIFFLFLKKSTSFVFHWKDFCCRRRHLLGL